MKVFKIAIITLVFALIFVKCASVSKLTNHAPEALKEAYYQNWNSGLKDGGSGTDLYIGLHDNPIILDSVYFRGQLSILSKSSNHSLLYIGRFSFNNQIYNELAESSFFPFQIKDNECLISYKLLKNNTLKYYRIVNVKMRKTLNYPGDSSRF
ncbi:hypothetical protein [uncultured Winogradskyella sp.]|uniref:hypothetical protein n=1 Tax=uncultured Winogradskyella sp. TaxID=395353 RepID=UPI00262A68D2|nr:hypothetical protein [uncultured Winogradskyella sp.]